MPGVRTVTELIAQVRRRADMENTTFVTDAEIEDNLQDSHGELYDLIIESNPTFNLQVSDIITTVSGTDTYVVYSSNPAPPDNPGVNATLYKLVGVDIKFGDKWRSMRPFALHQRNALNNYEGAWPNNAYYSLVGPGTPALTNTDRRIRFIPTPTSAEQVRVHYIPVPVLDSSTPMQAFSGWDEYIVCDAAAKCLEKEESFAQADRLLARKMAAAERIRYHAMTMDLNDAGQVRDAYADVDYEDMLPRP